jgi:polar amino acid transport system substrate-binding protein
MIQFYKNYLAILIVNTLLLFVSLYGQTEEIKVVTELLEPYQIQHADGSIGGFSNDVVKALFKVTQDKPNIQVMPWARAYEVALHKPNILIYSIAHTKSRNNKFHWIGAFKEEHLYFWGLKKHYAKTDYKVSALKNFKIAVSRSSNSAQYLIAQNFSNIYQLANERQNMNMLFIDRVDLILATQITIESRAKSLGYDFNDLQRLNEVAALNTKLSIAFSLESSDVSVKKYQAAFQQLVNNGQLESLKEKWKLY